MILNIQKVNKIYKTKMKRIQKIKLKKKLHLQMHMDSKANFLHQDIKNQIPLNSFMKIKITFNMADQPQEEEIDLKTPKKDCKLLTN